MAVSISVCWWKNTNKGEKNTGWICYFIMGISDIKGLSILLGMKLFRIFKKKTQKSQNLNPEGQLRYLIDYIPDFYKDQRQYINAGMFLDHCEWDLALDSLIELTDETGHYFSEEFWTELAGVANKLNLTDQANFCIKQIERNKEYLNFKTSFGITIAKIDDHNFIQYISERIKQEWANKRRDKDNIHELVKKNGVYLKSKGTNGFAYIVKDSKLAEVEFELGVKGLIIYFSNLNNWILPNKHTLKPEEKLKIRNDIRNWSTETGNAIEFDD